MSAWTHQEHSEVRVPVGLSPACSGAKPKRILIPAPAHSRVDLRRFGDVLLARSPLIEHLRERQAPFSKVRLARATLERQSPLRVLRDVRAFEEHTGYMVAARGEPEIARSSKKLERLGMILGGSRPLAEHSPEI